jgi:3-hydroxybutyryl-CoA dehydratase
VSAPEVAPAVLELTQPLLQQYADASGDHNPIHIDEEFAKTTQMGGTIAHGMLVLSFISEMMAGAFGKRWLESGSLEVRFRNPARPGDRVTASATPQAPKDGRLRYAVECVNDAGEQLITGTAEVSA